MNMHPFGDYEICARRSPSISIAAGVSSSYVCTRESGHDGSHLANSTEAVAALWDREMFWNRVYGWVLL